MITSKPYSTAGSVVDQAAENAQDAIRSTQRTVNDALDGLHAKAAPVLSRISERSTDLARRAKESGYHLRDKAVNYSHATTDYIKTDPVKSVLIAAAAGAALMALVSLLSRPRDH